MRLADPLRKYSRPLMMALAIAAVFALGFFIRGLFSSSQAEPSHSEKHAFASETKETPSLWTCSMHPQIRRSEPGNCPICGMKLVPVTSSASGIRQITLSPAVLELMKLKTSPVERKYVTATVRMVGKIMCDETRLAYISAWVSGRLDRLFVDYTGVQVKRGDHMVYIYSPELYSAQTELIQAIKFADMGTGLPAPSSGNVDLVESAREKLRLLGMTVEQIKEIESSKKPSYHLTVYSPSGGIVIDKLRQNGDYVKTGDRIYTIADLSQVWVMLDAYESDLLWIRYGQEVEFTTDAYPGEKFVGKIAFIDPVLNDKTRTVKVRVNVPNPAGKLKPDMFVHGIVRSRIAAGGRVMAPGLAGKWISPMHPEIVSDEPGKCSVCGMPLVRAESLGYVAPEAGTGSEPLVVPVSAALVTGTRAIVYVQVPAAAQPTFEGREIVLGPRAGDYYLVRSGLKEGELVVTNGNFKIDSALQIQAKPSMMTPAGGGGGGHDHGGHGGSGAEKKTAQTTAAAEIPAEFHKQLAALDAAFRAASQAVATEELPRIRSSFTAFGKALEQVDIKLLKGHAHMLWNEFDMLLTNDVVEGKDVKQLADAKRVFSSLTERMDRVRGELGHSGHGTEHALHLPPIPAEFQKQLGDLWKAYLPLQDALASDDLKRARLTVSTLKSALKAVDAKLLADAAIPLWTKESEQLNKIFVTLEKSGDLKTIREEFSSLSGALAAVVRTFGLQESGSVYEFNCSMAFGGRGGKWLQSNAEPQNPYYGAAMLRCADPPRLIAGQAAKEHGGGHQHD